MTFKLKIAAILGIMGAVACSGKKESVQRVPYKGNRPVVQGAQPSIPTYVFADALPESTACAFLDSQRVEKFDAANHHLAAFQLYENFYTNDEGIFVGAHAVAKLPQVLFLLSKEGSADWGPLYRSYDIWSFYRLAKHEMCDKISTFCAVLNDRETNYESRRTTLEEIAATEIRVKLGREELRQAQVSRDREAFLAAEKKVVTARNTLTGLRAQIAELEQNNKFLDGRLKARAKEIKKNGDPDQIDALGKLEKLLRGMSKWDGMASTLVRSQFVDARNEEIENLVNRRIPGALDGEVGPVDRSDLYVMYFRYLRAALPVGTPEAVHKTLVHGLSEIRPVLTGNYALFGADTSPSDWASIDRDVQVALTLLQQRPTDLQDATCKFVISQRLIAQIVSIKGIRQSPKLTRDGLLPKLESDLNHQVPHHDIPGVYGDVVDEDWIQKACLSPAQDMPLPNGSIDQNTGTVLPLEYFSYMRFLAHLVETANASFWIKNKDSPDMGELIPIDLLKLSFGMMAAGWLAVETHFLKVDQNSATIQVKPEDSAQNFAVLVKMTVESLRAFDAQYRLHQENPAAGFLNDEQLASLRDSGDKKTLLVNLLYASSKGAIAFYNLKSTDAATRAEIKAAINNAGAYLRNDALYQFGK